MSVILFISDSNSPHPNNKSELALIPHLPDIVVQEILKKFPNWRSETESTTKTMLICRLVCMQWNAIIEDTTELMKKITLPVWDPVSFLKLPLVQKGKIKSIIFRNSFPINKDASKLIEVISNIVERVEFAFKDPSAKEQQRELFVLILQKCNRIRELIIGNAYNGYD